ncbi:MAG TPA: biotin/lipoyl-containing protein [Thermoanaerobaculia bacterium]
MSEKRVTIGSSEQKLVLEKNGSGWTASAEGASVAVRLVAVHDGWAEVTIGERAVAVPFTASGERVEFLLDGEIWRAEVSGSGGSRRARHADHSLEAPMPGQVLKIFVEVGDQVGKGDPLMVLEAMKMEHQIVAPFAGLVESIGCSVGELVQPGVDLIALVAEETA